MTLNEYINKINKRYITGISREHSYRGDLQTLLETLAPEVLVTNEPARVACGAPDYIITRKNIPVGYIEAKDIGADLSNKNYKEQFERYKLSLNNLIITDYLTFQLFIDGIFITSISIGEIQGSKIVSRPENFAGFIDLIKNFCVFTGQTIKSASKLSKMMAGKARLLANVIERALDPDVSGGEIYEPQNLNLHNQYESFKQILIHDLTIKSFADIYSQTIAYGMFAARLHDTSLENFTRQEAAELIPKSNPFLRKLFQYVAGYDLDDRIKWIVDALADIFRATNVEELLKDFGKSTHQHDPMIHFYETFLTEYDPALRKSRGVWYTPEPVVNFIVRAVDDILKTEFGLSQGLADTSKIKIKVQTPGTSKPTEKEVHRVQILDPAAGTGTFLAEVIKQIHTKFEGQEGIWSQYVDEHLIPRLNGFEILMASYAMAHLKLDMLLTETGYKSNKEQRFRIYLTNSLEEHHPDTGTLFANWLSTEANEANHVKRDTPVMVVLGNPPYSGISTNKGEWITKLIDDYKYVDGEYFNERKHWLNDDYVKFIRISQDLIDKNGDGVLAFINNHSFLDNPTFRGMRWHLLNSFDLIYILDLHGNSKKKEVNPDGSVDKNVFDIQAGVSINIFVKTGNKKKGVLAKVKHTDLWGTRESKYQKLFINDLSSFSFSNVENEKPYYFFQPKDSIGRGSYENSFSINDLMITNVTGLVTARDSLVIDINKDELLNKISKFAENSLTDDQIRSTFFPGKKTGKYLAGDSRGWQLATARRKIINNDHLTFIKKISYRPFDERSIYYTSDMVDWGREKIMHHFLDGNNIGLVFSRQATDKYWSNIQVTTSMIDNRYHFSYKGIPQIAPLYLYPEMSNQTTTYQHIGRLPNLNKEILLKISDKLSFTFTVEKESSTNTFAPIDVLDYTYAVLYSPTYRSKFNEFLKIDFPRVPYPQDADTFWKLVKLGGELRQIHLLESPIVNKFITTYPVNGSNNVTKLKYEDGKVRINLDQYFDHVPQVAWEFYIGGYQPAQKWLKDRKGRVLSYEDIQHYQKIIVALVETDRIMKEIDCVEILN
jgi:predicted helicase